MVSITVFFSNRFQPEINLIDFDQIDSSHFTHSLDSPHRVHFCKEIELKSSREQVAVVDVDNGVDLTLKG